MPRTSGGRRSAGEPARRGDVVAHPGNVLVEEHRRDQFATAAHAGLLEDRLEDELGRPGDELVAIDTSSVLAVRERAIACHLSQGSPFDGLSADLRRRFLTTDHVVEVTWRWTSLRSPQDLGVDEVAEP